MVKVRFMNLGPRGKLLHADLPESVIIMEGHAGFGVEGTDIVCAGVSAVVQTAVAGIARVAGFSQRVRSEKGYLETRIGTADKLPGEIERLEVVVHTMILGLQEIEKAHRGSVELVFEENS